LNGGSTRRSITTYEQDNTKNKRIYILMFCVGFEPMTTFLQPAKTVHALDRRPLRSAFQIRWVSPTKRNLAPLKLYNVSLCNGNNTFLRFEVITAVTMKNAVFWHIEPQFIPHRKQYFSATEPSLLGLWNIGGFHGGNYEDCRLL
jgi:hypothetical protein